MALGGSDALQGKPGPFNGVLRYSYHTARKAKGQKHALKWKAKLGTADAHMIGMKRNATKKEGEMNNTERRARQEVRNATQPTKEGEKI